MIVEDHFITTLSETHTIHSPSSGKLLSCVKLSIFKFHFDISPLSRNKSGSNFLLLQIQVFSYPQWQEPAKVLRLNFSKKGEQ